MAIIKGTFATKLKGRVGNVVYRIADGKNIASERPASVKNPRTAAQQEQRMRMATIMAAYSSLKAVCDHSFEGLTYGAKNMAEFMRVNLLLAKDWKQSFNIKGNQTIVANPYQVSKGSLGALDAVSVTGNKIAMLSSADTLATMTVQQFFAAFGLQVGDQLTILAMIPAKGSTTFGTYTQQNNAVYYRRIIAKLGTESKLMFTGSAVNTEVLEDTSIVNGVTFEIASGTLNAVFTGVTQILAGAVIGSAKANGKWERTTSFMVVNADATKYPAAAIVESYSVSADYYLNNGEAVAGNIVEGDGDAGQEGGGGSQGGQGGTGGGGTGGGSGESGEE